MGPHSDPFYQPVANYGYDLGDGVTLITRWQAPTAAAPLGAGGDVGPTDSAPSDSAQQASCSCRTSRIGMTGALLAFLGGSVVAALLTRE